MKAKSSRELKEIDHRCVWEYRIPTLLLMEHAGKGAAQAAAGMNPLRRLTLVVAGKGNYGGDGLVAARFLRLAGFPVKVWLLGGGSQLRKGSAPWYNLQMVKYLGVPLAQYVSDFQMPDLRDDLRDAGLIVDAIFGIGLAGEVREPYAGIIRALNESGNKVLAIDIPSGLDADTGAPLGVAVKAHKTVTFIAPKMCFETEQGRQYCGQIELVDIGVPAQLL